MRAREYSSKHAYLNLTMVYKSQTTTQHRNLVMMVDPGCTTSHGPRRILSQLGLPPLAERECEIVGQKQKTTRAVTVGLQLPDPKSKKIIRIIVDIDYFIESKDDPDVEEDPNVEEWLLGMDFLQYFKHTWNGLKQVKLKLLQEHEPVVCKSLQEWEALSNSSTSSSSTSSSSPASTSSSSPPSSGTG